MVAITAQQMLDETNYTIADISKTNLEYLIDNAINYVNLEAGTSISNMTGTAESKTVTVTSAQSAVLKPLITLMVKAYKDKGPGGSVGTLSVSTTLQHPEYAFYLPLLEKGLNRLRGRSFERV